MSALTATPCVGTAAGGVAGDTCAVVAAGNARGAGAAGDTRAAGAANTRAAGAADTCGAAANTCGAAGACTCGAVARLLSRSDIFKPLLKEDYEDFLEKEREAMATGQGLQATW